LGIADGLRYLHALAVVHADIKAENVLVSSSGEPLLADFGLSRMKETCVSKGYYSTETIRSSIRWCAFEYYNHPHDEIFRPTQKTDVWAFGMTLLELVTRDAPYAHIKSDNMVITELVTGKLPPKPTINDSSLDPDANLKHFMWSVCEMCWTEDPKTRPSMQDVLKKMSDYHREHYLACRL